MSKLILILLILLLTIPAIADTYRYDNRTMISDQGGFQHWAIGAAWGTLAKSKKLDLKQSLLVCAGLSVIKEIADDRRGSAFSILDIGYAMIGTYTSWSWSF